MVIMITRPILPSKLAINSTNYGIMHISHYGVQATDYKIIRRIPGIPGIPGIPVKEKIQATGKNGGHLESVVLH